MRAAATAVKNRLPWCMRAIALVPLLLSRTLWAQAPIEIKPLPESKHATVTQLGAAELSVAELQPWLDGEMHGVMQKGAVTGAVVVVVKDGEVLYTKGYGYADPETKKAVDPADTMFRVGAMSGVVTATAVMQLVEQHKLDLDADVNRYLDFTLPPKDGKPVTLRDLLTYTPGFEDVGKSLYITEPKEQEQQPYVRWLKQWVQTPTRIYPPGDVAAYSTYGTALVGYIVQRVSGQPFEDYVQRHIFEPMGMRHATFRQNDPLWQNLASNVGTPAPLWKLVQPTPATGLAISGNDMAQFMIAQLQYGRAGNAQLLEQSTVQAMQGYQRATIPGLPGMALGFAHMDRDGQTVLGHDGDFNGYHSLLVLLPEHHTGIFVATAGGDTQSLLRPMVERFADRYFPPLPQLKQPTLGADKQHAAQLVGRYTSSITSQDNVLALRDLFRQSTIGTTADGSLLAPMFGAAHWREVKPYLWKDDASGRWLGAVVREGKVRMVSTDALSPMEVYLPAIGASPASVTGVVSLLVAVFALIVLSWPALALPARRRASQGLPEQDVRWYRLSRLTALLYLLFAAGWYVLLPRLGMPNLEGRLMVLCLIGSLAVLGTVAVAMETWRAWHGGAWWRRISGVVLLLACLGAIAFIISWHLLSLSPNY